MNKRYIFPGILILLALFNFGLILGSGDLSPNGNIKDICYKVYDIEGQPLMISFMATLEECERLTQSGEEVSNG